MSVRFTVNVSLSALFAILTVVSATAAAETAIPVDFKFAAYMRSGIGDNDKGGKQSCFNNPGSVGNEFRLGNECGTYGEASLQAIMLKPQKAGDQFFRSQLTFAYFPPNDSQYEDTATAGNHDINVVEAFVQGGNFGEVKAEFWAGKRFYRVVDVHMNDLYYFDNMNGTGGGAERIATPWGSLNVAILRESVFAQPGLPPAGLTTPTQTRVDSTSAGILGKTALDVRYDIPIGDRNSASVWAVAAFSPPGSGTIVNPAPTATTPVAPATATYEAGRGYVGGLYYRRVLDHEGFNDVAVAYGTGIMQSLEMRGGGVVDGSGGNSASRLRLVESFNHSFGEKLAALAVAMYEDRNSGATIDPHSTWWNIGVRPYYAFSEHFSLVGELGHSEVRDDADRDVKGNHIATRQMNRVTLAPQLAIQSGIFARPVIRAFVSQTFWNDANQKFTNGGAVQSVSSTPAYMTQLSGTSIGVQTEVWF